MRHASKDRRARTGDQQVTEKCDASWLVNHVLSLPYVNKKTQQNMTYNQWQPTTWLNLSDRTRSSCAWIKVGSNWSCSSTNVCYLDFRLCRCLPGTDHWSGGCWLEMTSLLVRAFRKIRLSFKPPKHRRMKKLHPRHSVIVFEVMVLAMQSI